MSFFQKEIYVKRKRKDEYVYEVNFQANKTSIDKSSIL